MNIQKSVILVALAFLLLAVSCTPSPSSPDYRILKVTRGIARFSLEYLTSWRVGTEIRSDYTRVAMSSSLLNAFGDLLVTPPNQTDRDAKTTMDNYVSLKRTQPDFQIVEESTLSVAGVSAFKIVYSYSALQLPKERGGTGGPPKPTTGVYMAFERDGLIWTLGAVSDPDKALEVQADLQYMLQTFKILD